MGTNVLHVAEQATYPSAEADDSNLYLFYAANRSVWADLERGQLGDAKTDQAKSMGFLGQVVLVEKYQAGLTLYLDAQKSIDHLAENPQAQDDRQRAELANDRNVESNVEQKNNDPVALKVAQDETDALIRRQRAAKNGTPGWLADLEYAVGRDVRSAGGLFGGILDPIAKQLSTGATILMAILVLIVLVRVLR